MTTDLRIGLIGDHDPEVTAHQAIPRSLALACATLSRAADWEWIHTSELDDDPSQRLAAFRGLWCVPASPYANTAGALAAIGYARRTGRAFLGTCGGFQHALLEYARTFWGVDRPAHAELEPDAADPVIAPLACSLVEQSAEIRFEPGSRLATIYGAATATETYHCRYGLNEAFGDRLSSGPLRVSARDARGDVRAIELDEHPFFVATLFQPERSALAGRSHPLIDAFVAAAHDRTPAHSG